LRSQTLNLLIRQLKHEVYREAIPVPTYLFIESARTDAIQLSKIGVEHHFLSAHEQDSRLDAIQRRTIWDLHAP
jgi:hypothetical protein